MGTVAQHIRGSTYFATAEWLTWKEDWTDRPRVGYGCLMAALRTNRIATACRLRAISIEDQGGTTIEQKKMPMPNSQCGLTLHIGHSFPLGRVWPSTPGLLCAGSGSL